MKKHKIHKLYTSTIRKQRTHKNEQTQNMGNTKSISNKIQIKQMNQPQITKNPTTHNNTHKINKYKKNNQTNTHHKQQQRKPLTQITKVLCCVFVCFCVCYFISCLRTIAKYYTNGTHTNTQTHQPKKNIQQQPQQQIHLT